jgi:ketosteroid isomerase-like protein
LRTLPSVASGEEFVRRLWAQWNSGDRQVRPEQVDAEVEIHSALTQAVYRGHEGVQRWEREIDEQFSDWKLELDSVDEREDGVLVVTGSISMRGRQSGLDLTQPASWIIELRDGRLLRLHNFVGVDAAAAELAARGS